MVRWHAENVVIIGGMATRKICVSHFFIAHYLNRPIIMSHIGDAVAHVLEVYLLFIPSVKQYGTDTEKDEWHYWVFS